MHRPYRDLQNLKFSCLYLFPFSHKVVPQKASGGGGVGGGVVYHTSTGQYIGVATFFFFFFVSGLKLDEKSIENGLEGQKFLVVCLFWGGCHHPNSIHVSGRISSCHNFSVLGLSNRPGMYFFKSRC